MKKKSVFKLGLTIIIFVGLWFVADAYREDYTWAILICNIYAILVQTLGYVFLAIIILLLLALIAPTLLSPFGKGTP